MSHSYLTWHRHAQRHGHKRAHGTCWTHSCDKTVWQDRCFTHPPDFINHPLRLQANTFQKTVSETVLLIVEYTYTHTHAHMSTHTHTHTHTWVHIIKILFWGFYSPESYPPHKIKQYWFYYSIWLGFSFPPDQYDRAELFCTTVVPVSKGHLGGASP